MYYLVIIFTAFIINCNASDESALRYVKDHHDARIVLLWPNSKQIKHSQKIERALDQYAKIIHTKKFRLINDGPLALVLQVYGHQKERIGTVENNFKVAREKVAEVFAKNKTLVRAYLINTNSKKMRPFKTAVRDKYGINFIHCTDNQKESISLAKVIFDDDSLDLLNASKP